MTEPFKAPYEHCWECSRQLYGRGRFYRRLRLTATGEPVYVHAQCAAQMIAAGEAEHAPRPTGELAAAMADAGLVDDVLVPVALRVGDEDPAATPRQRRACHVHLADVAALELLRATDILLSDVAGCPGDTVEVFQYNPQRDCEWPAAAVVTIARVFKVRLAYAWVVDLQFSLHWCEGCGACARCWLRHEGNDIRILCPACAELANVGKANKTLAALTAGTGVGVHRLDIVDIEHEQRTLARLKEPTP